MNTQYESTDTFIYSGSNDENTLDIEITYDEEACLYSVFLFISSIRNHDEAFYDNFDIEDDEMTLEEVIEEAQGWILDRATDAQMAKMSPEALAQLKANQALFAA